MQKKIDTTEFRNSLSTFPTGVTVITTADQNGNPAGITVSSFNSVSLNPPLILWSIARRTPEFDVFINAPGFCVHVLAETQQDISNRFANPSQDKFDQLKTVPGTCFPEIRCLTEYTARFECLTWNQYDGGDHIIMVGEVLHFEHTHRKPLLFALRTYTRLESSDHPTSSS